MNITGFRHLWYLVNENLTLQIKRPTEGLGEWWSKLVEGNLYTHHSDLDLLELHRINNDLANHNLTEIDLKTLLSTFKGHTVFSIYSDQITVIECIQKILSSIERLPDKSFEPMYLKQLLTILQLPTYSLKSTLTSMRDDTSKSLRSWLT